VLPVRRLEPDGAHAWATVERRGLEGFVAKDPASSYRAGPTRSWIKVKLRHERVFVVGGIRIVDAFDGALVGEKVGDELRYRGVVEWVCLPLIRPIGLRRSPQAFVMEPTHAWHLHHPALAWWLHAPWLGCVLDQR